MNAEAWNFLGCTCQSYRFNCLGKEKRKHLGSKVQKEPRSVTPAVGEAQTMHLILKKGIMGTRLFLPWLYIEGKQEKSDK